MQEIFKSDLAIEYTEYFYNSSEQSDDIRGVAVEEYNISGTDIHVTDVWIKTAEGERIINKPKGHYLTIEAPSLESSEDAYHQHVTEAVGRQLRQLIPDIQQKKVLAVGIGNREITPDALGPKVIEHLFVTRHLIMQYGPDSEVVRGMGNVSAVIPGVMGQTGIETGEILKALVKETAPDLLVVVDALAARHVERLMTTVQVTDTGIHPGAGVGNHRFELTQETLGIPVIAIGVPTVIDAATIVADTMETLLEVLEKEPVLSRAAAATKSFDHQEKYLLMRELMEPQMADMFVTPKDVDASVERISYTISEAINGLCHDIPATVNGVHEPGKS